MKTLLGSPKRIVWLLLLLAVLLIIGLSAISGWIQDWLWMRQVGYAAVFWRILSIKFAAAGVAILIVFFFFWLNLRFAVNAIFRLRGNVTDGSLVIYTKDGIGLSVGWLKVITLVISAVIGLIFALTFYSQWDVYLRFHWAPHDGPSSCRCRPWKSLASVRERPSGCGST